MTVMLWKTFVNYHLIGDSTKKIDEVFLPITTHTSDLWIQKIRKFISLTMYGPV